MRCCNSTVQSNGFDNSIYYVNLELSVTTKLQRSAAKTSNKENGKKKRRKEKCLQFNQNNVELEISEHWLS
jgi:hypothetical protein